MALHSHRFPINITSPFWIVWGGDDGPATFTDRAEVEHYLTGFFRQPFQVFEADPDTGKLWDATVEFDGTLDIERDESDGSAWDRECSRADRHHRLAREGAL